MNTQRRKREGKEMWLQETDKKKMRRVKRREERVKKEEGERSEEEGMDGCSHY